MLCKFTAFWEYSRPHNVSLNNSAGARKRRGLKKKNCLQFMTRLRLSEDHAKLQASYDDLAKANEARER